MGSRWWRSMWWEIEVEVEFGVEIEMGSELKSVVRTVVRQQSGWQPVEELGGGGEGSESAAVEAVRSRVNSEERVGC